MLTEYELTTQASPVSGGSVQGAGWFAAGTSARLVAVPNPGFQFAGFTGGHLKTQLNPAAITMNAPTAVTGIFSTTPPASITAMLMPPTGPLHARNWTISVLNEGPGVAYDTNLVLLGFRQTAGAPCVVLPMRLNPVMFPVYVGVMPVRGMANISTTLDFTGCPPDALFTVTMVLAANGGSSGGVVRLMNQVQ
jgi:hypothetical protein